MPEKVSNSVPVAIPKQAKITKAASPVSERVKLACFCVFALGSIATSFFIGHGYSFSSPEVIVSLTFAGAPILVSLGLMAHQAYVHYQNNRETKSETFQLDDVLKQTRGFFDKTGHVDSEINIIPSKCWRTSKDGSFVLAKTTTLKGVDKAYQSGDFLGVIYKFVASKYEGTGYRVVSRNKNSETHFYFDSDKKLLKIKTSLEFKLTTHSVRLGDNPKEVGTVIVKAEIDVPKDETIFRIQAPVLD